jgi:hypothetical protein
MGLVLESRIKFLTFLFKNGNMSTLGLVPNASPYTPKREPQKRWRSRLIRVARRNMGCYRYLVWFLLLCIILEGLANGVVAAGLACNWGTRSTHPLPPTIVVKLLKDNGFSKVKLFEADPGALKALGNSGIQVMVGIPNEFLASLASSVGVAENWVTKNVSTFISKHGADIR